MNLANINFYLQSFTKYVSLLEICFYNTAYISVNSVLTRHPDVTHY